ncbi:hypothetical protein EDF74_1229 [Stenotrophomonas rhizophila]|uniref:hypothetical protein n=1 Tax=Stenotrophomonas rhizophila TaxID=216778 RepID=UPI000F4C75DE|nr:hypothetical protein [Stenotrophomonas rhizophila]ROP80160.1 hypothetical protein EDF74_1229 [Stenotrophomonas rhizophila]
MLNASLLSVASVTPTDPEPVVQATDGALRAAIKEHAPLQGRALIAQLERLAQQELAMLARQPVDPAAAPIDPALAGLAWDLGLSGDDLGAAAR